MEAVEDSWARQSQAIAADIHQVVSDDLDPARWRAETSAALRERLTLIRQRLIALAEGECAETEGTMKLRASLMSLADALGGTPEPSDSSVRGTKRRWARFRRLLIRRYGRLVASLSELEVHVPELRPTNYRRSLVHAVMALATLALLYLLPSSEYAIAASGIVVLMAWTAEFLRRRSEGVNDLLMKWFAPIAHPHEWRRVNSATWYCTTVFLLALLRDPAVASISLMVLGLGDPAAALVGRRWGKHQIVHGRSIEGSLALMVVGTAFAVAASLVFAPQWSFSMRIGVCSAAAVGGAIAELVSLRIDDNLSIGLASALVSLGVIAAL